jgi:3-oxoacyl-[acyl-carrier protein] reductase
MLPLDDWRLVLDSSLTGAFLCTRRALPAMVEKGWGRIVNISSVVGINGFPGDAAYAAAKAGLIGLTRAVALEHARHGITVNAVAPGFIDTDMLATLSERVRARVTGAVPLRRLGTCEEVAEAVERLVLSDYSTGETVVLDGGWLRAAALR